MPARFQVTELAGYTARVSEMLDVFEDVNQGIYRRSADRDEELTAPGGEGAVVQHGHRVYGRLLEMRGESIQLHSRCPGEVTLCPGELTFSSGECSINMSGNIGGDFQTGCPQSL